MAQWCERSPPTNVARVRFPVSVSYVGWVCWDQHGSRLCSEGFSPGTLVFLPPQKPTFPNSISIWKQPSGSKSHSVDSTEIPIYFILLSFLQSFAMKSDPLLKNISRAFRQSFGYECVEFVRKEPETPTGHPD